MSEVAKKSRLWTKNFIFLLTGNFFVQMASSAIAFVLSLFVLEISNSVFLYGIYLTIYYSTRIVVPVAFGPYIEKNNKKTTYKLCCLAFVVSYTTFFIVYISSYYNLVFTILFSLVSGLINAVYLVNENSFLVEIVDKENFQKAYSINNAMSYLSYVSQPIGTFVYKYIGIKSILIVSIVLFIVGLLLGLKTNILRKESDEENETSYFEKIKNGLKFFFNDKAIFPMLLIVFVSNVFLIGIVDVIWLPYFNEYVNNSYLYYFLCIALAGTGVFHSSILVYFIKAKKELLYIFTFFSFAIALILRMTAIMLPLVTMLIVSYLSGLFEGLSDSLLMTKILSTIDSNKKSQFIASSTAARNIGVVIGMALASVLSEFMSLKSINLVFGLLISFITVFIIIKNRFEILKFYK